MEFRRIFDTIPEQFDQFRPRYSPELFDFLIDAAGRGHGISLGQVWFINTAEYDLDADILVLRPQNMQY